jgi:hypothetical protein
MMPIIEKEAKDLTDILVMLRNRNIEIYGNELLSSYKKRKC